MAPYVAVHFRGEGAASRLTAVTYLAGRFVCHQRPDRSFHAWGAQLPVCARCAGLYFAAPVGAIAALRRRSWGRGRRLRLVLIGAALPLLLTWTLEAAGWIDPGNAQRALWALPLGFAACWVAIRAIDERPEVN
jgi:uncharacterized membrane protein